MKVITGNYNPYLIQYDAKVFSYILFICNIILYIVSKIPLYLYIDCVFYIISYITCAYIDYISNITVYILFTIPLYMYIDYVC